MHETQGVYFGQDITAESVADQIDAISNTKDQEALPGAFDQTKKYVEKALAARKGE